MIISSRKYQMEFFFRQVHEHFKAIHLRHFNVKENKLRLQLFNCLHTFTPIFSFTNYYYRRTIISNLLPERNTPIHFIIDNQSCHHQCILSFTSTHVPEGSPSNFRSVMLTEAISSLLNNLTLSLPICIPYPGLSW